MQTVPLRSYSKVALAYHTIVALAARHLNAILLAKRDHETLMTIFVLNGNTVRARRQDEISAPTRFGLDLANRRHFQKTKEESHGDGQPDRQDEDTPNRVTAGVGGCAAEAAR